jgi:hypothetical protein
MERYIKCYIFCCALYRYTTLQNTPGQLVFGCDMIVNVKHKADWEYIRARKQNLIIKDNKAENAKRIPHNYAVGDKVSLKITTLTSSHILHLVTE